MADDERLEQDKYEHRSDNVNAGSGRQMRVTVRGWRKASLRWRDGKAEITPEMDNLRSDSEL